MRARSTVASRRYVRQRKVPVWGGRCTNAVGGQEWEVWHDANQEEARGPAYVAQIGVAWLPELL